MPELQIFYLTLVGPFAGYCLKIHAINELAVREYAASNYGKLWCSVYTEEYWNRSRVYPHEVQFGEDIWLLDNDETVEAVEVADDTEV